MWVASNDVEEVVDWFFRRSSSQFLGLFVAGDPKFDSLLRAVIANRQTIDVVLGRSIDMVLFSGTEFELGQKIPIRHISKVTKWTPKRTRSISNATVMSTHEIAESLELGVDDLPGLVLLRKAVDRRDLEAKRLVLSLRGATDVDFLIEFLRAFRKSIERIETARSIGLSFSKASLAELERNMTCRIDQAAVIEKREERIARYVKEAQVISEPPDTESEQARVAEQRMNKAQIAKYNAELRVTKLDAKMPIDNTLKCMVLVDEDIKELHTVIEQFERRLSYNLTWDRCLKFLGLSEKMLSGIKRVIELAVAIKTGGTSLL